jgi:tetratricopeptide (TPR) repeat protein
MQAAPLPTHPRVAALLAAAAKLLQAGRPAEAVPVLREAAGWAPGNAAILHDLGLACLSCGLLAESVAALTAAITANPRFADSHLRLGIALEAQGALDAALAAYRRAAALLPKLADASYREGDLLETLGRATEAAAAFRRAAAAAPKTTLGRIATAKALLAENRDAEAEKILRQALALEKGNAAALELLGHVLAESGRFDEARATFARAIDNAPLRAGLYYELVRCQRIMPQDAGLVDKMRAATALPGLEPAQRSRVHLALGKAADDLGEYAEAMRHCDLAEALRNSITRFDLPAFEARVDRLIAECGPERTAIPGCQDPTPILIVGLPRSGTTLVEQILSAHPDVGAGGELSFWNEHGRDFPNAQASPTVAADYLRLLRGIAPRAVRVTDKMPLNFQWAGLIHAAFPNATILHCRRRPIDTALSIHQTHFNPRMDFPTGGAALVGYIRAYQRLMAHWRLVLPPERFVDVEYEALAETPEPVISRLVTACGLDWHPACLRPDENRRVVKTPSKWQARQPIYRHAVDRSRAYAPWLGPLSVLAERQDVLS